MGGDGWVCGEEEKKARGEKRREGEGSGTEAII